MPETRDEQGRAASKGLHDSAKRDERKAESEKGSDLKKGADRPTERSKSTEEGGTGPNETLNKV
jgi:hypothetical protein